MVSYAQLMNMSKKIKPNELRIVHAATGTDKNTDKTKMEVRPKTEVKAGSSHKAVSRPNDPKVNNLKNKMKEPITASKKSVTKTDKRMSGIEYHGKQANSKEHVDASKALQRPKKNVLPANVTTKQSKNHVPIRTATVERNISKTSQSTSSSKSSKHLPKEGTSKKTHFSLNPYAVDPTDPLISGDPLNISSYIGNLFGYSKKRYICNFNLQIL